MNPPNNIIVCGYPRSGTTMFHSMLNFTVSSHKLFNREYQALPYLREKVPVITKRTLDIFKVDEIVNTADRLNKSIHFVILMRDARDVLLSIHKSVPNDYFISWDNQYFVPHIGLPTKTKPGIFQIHNAMIDTKKRYPNLVTFLKYEDIVADPNGIQKKLGDELGIVYNGNKFSDFHTSSKFQNQGALNGLRPVDVSNQGKWKLPEHKARIIQQFNQAPELHKILRVNQYESDTKWFEDLKNGVYDETG